MKTTIKYMIGILALFFAGCDNEQEETTYPEGPVEVLLTATGSDFILTRGPIGEKESGLKFGEFYLLQTGVADDTESWCKYKILSGEAGKLSPIENQDPLKWADLRTQYYFRGISVPKPEGDSEPGVTVSYDNTTGELLDGTVRFGGYRTGLEYFVGVTVGPTCMADNSVLSMSFKRQVCKVIFRNFIHKMPNTANPTYPDKCTIIFPNLPTFATFDMNHFRARQGIYDQDEGLVQGNDYVTLAPGDGMGISMEWNRKLENEKNESIEHSCYLPPFRFESLDDNRPESQPGFFIVILDDEHTYTGNLHGNNQYEELYAGHFYGLIVTLKDGNLEGGGNGSAIAEWIQAPETVSPHHRVPGIYSKEDAAALLDALLNGKEIPATFYEEVDSSKRIIRLFMNIDWSSVSEEVKIPDDCVLMGQGFNIKLGEGGKITGEMEGKLYINGELHKGIFL